MNHRTLLALGTFATACSYGEAFAQRPWISPDYHARVDVLPAEVVEWRSCGTYRYRRAGRCVDARVVPPPLRVAAERR